MELARHFALFNFIDTTVYQYNKNNVIIGFMRVIYIYIYRTTIE